MRDEEDRNGFDRVFDFVGQFWDLFRRVRERVTGRPLVGCPVGCLLMLSFCVPFVPMSVWPKAGWAEPLTAVLLLPFGLLAFLGLWGCAESFERMLGRGGPSDAEIQAAIEAESRAQVESDEPKREAGPLGPLPASEDLKLGEFVFHAAGFNVTKEDPDWINPGLFGEDLADWFEERFVERGLSIGLKGDEDWGWYVDAIREGVTYTLSVSGFPELREGLPDIGEWHVQLLRRRSLVDRLLFRGRLEPDDPVLAMVAELVAELEWKGS